MEAVESQDGTVVETEDKDPASEQDSLDVPYADGKWLVLHGRSVSEYGTLTDAVRFSRDHLTAGSKVAVLVSGSLCRYTVESLIDAISNL